MNFLNVFKHVLPNGKAWRLTINRQLREFFKGISSSGDFTKRHIDQIWLDIFPNTTRELEKWENQFGLPVTELSEMQRRQRLAAAWQALGGQSPSYIQGVLRANGFNVTVHDWWSSDGFTPHSPVLLLRREYTNLTPGVEAGESYAQAGEPEVLCGNTSDPRGYPLVNKIIKTEPDYLVLAGESEAQAGERIAESGNYTRFLETRQNYIVPEDQKTWRYFMYVGADDINDIAQVEQSRRDEFENLLLKICPAHLWIGVLVEYPTNIG